MSDIYTLNSSEVAEVNGGPGPLAALGIGAGFGALAGFGSSLYGQMTDGEPGVDFGYVGAKTAYGAGVGLTATAAGMSSLVAGGAVGAAGAIAGAGW